MSSGGVAALEASDTDRFAFVTAMGERGQSQREAFAVPLLSLCSVRGMFVRLVLLPFYSTWQEFPVTSPPPKVGTTGINT